MQTPERIVSGVVTISHDYESKQPFNILTSLWKQNSAFKEDEIATKKLPLLGLHKFGGLET